MTLAIIQCADTGPLESLVIMLRAAGVDCALPNEELKCELRKIGCDTVLDISGLVRGMGYEEPMPLPFVGVSDMSRPDVFYICIKGVRSYDKVIRRWPNLAGKVIWYRIQGAKPEHVINARGDHGNELNPPCPVITPNRWYALQEWEVERPICPGDRPVMTIEPTPWADRSYSFWPALVRERDHDLPRPNTSNYSPPICLLHNFVGWGYGALEPIAKELGIRIHGAGSPDGLIDHKAIPTMLSRTLAMVHFKSSDAPGYALLEAMASGCPIICTRRLIWRCHMQELLTPGETCLVFDRETHGPLTPDDIANCRREISNHLEWLRNPSNNRKLGDAGRQRLREVSWRAERDGSGFQEFLQRHLGGLK